MPKDKGQQPWGKKKFPHLSKYDLSGRIGEGAYGKVDEYTIREEEEGLPSVVAVKKISELK